MPPILVRRRSQFVRVVTIPILLFPVPITLLVTDSSLGSQGCRTLIAATLVSLDLVVVTICTRMLRLALFTIIQRSFHQLKLLELESLFVNFRNSSSGTNGHRVAFNPNDEGFEGPLQRQTRMEEKKEDSLEVCSTSILLPSLNTRYLSSINYRKSHNLWKVLGPLGKEHLTSPCLTH